MKISFFKEKLNRRSLIRVTALFLALVMLWGSVGFAGDIVKAYENDEYTDYGAVIGHSARLQTDYFISFPIADSKASADYDVYDLSAGRWGEDESYLWYDPENGKYEFSLDLKLVIIGYYVNEETGALWYEVKAAPGQTLPEKLANNPWIYQNQLEDLSEEYYYNSLSISDEPENFVFDGEGNIIDSTYLPLDEKVTVSAESTLIGKVSYQWQICIDGEWLDICGQTEKSLTLTAALLANAVDENLFARVRVVANNGIETVYGKETGVSVILEEETENIVGVQKALAEAAPAEDGPGAVVDTVTVTVRFIYGQTGNEVGGEKSYVIQYGGGVSDAFNLPVMEGYSAYLEDDTENIYTSYSFDLENVTEDTVITFRYWPAKVNYTVIYYQQHAEDDGYSEVRRETFTDFTGNIAEVPFVAYEGFYQLLYEEVAIASDSSTVVEVYYDRLYYKMTFGLDGGYGVQPIYTRFDTHISIPVPTKAGCTFVGWDADGDGIADTIPETIPARNTAFTAIWQKTDNAKVTVVYWGENGKDTEYNYEKSQELYVKPGTELSFTGEDELVCTLEPHTHGTGCKYDCGMEVHEHTLANNCYILDCDKVPHNHVSARCTERCIHDAHELSCYSAESGYLRETDKPSNTLSGGANGIYTYTTYILFFPVTHYYLNIGDKWYCAHSSGGAKQDTESISLDCGHSHGDDCYTCGIEANDHTHSIEGDCYDLTCTRKAHSHTADCYSCIQHSHNDSCYMKKDSMDTDLWTYEKSDTVTVSEDGTTVINVYYKRTTKTITFHYGNNNKTTGTITAKWGDDIGEEFIAMGTKASGNLWSRKTSGASPYTSYLSIMPEEDRDYYLNSTSSSKKIATYYTQNPDGSYTGLEIVAYSGSNLTITAEDFYDMDGYEYSHGTDGSGNDMPSPGTYRYYDGAEFYYVRKGYQISYNNGEGIVKNESARYHDNLGDYEFTPDAPAKYEPGSVKFSGWYLNPECTGNEFVLSDHTMQAENLLLYAKWEPVEHTVRFYTDEALVGSDSTYGLYEKIKHGSLLQDPYIPPNDPEKGQYIFEGWFYMDQNGKEQMWDFENTTVRGDTDIYAKWSSNTLVSYTVRYVYVDKDNNEIEIAPEISGSALGGNSKTFDAKTNDQLNEGYQSKYFATVQSHTITMDLENLENNTYTFYYEKIDSVPYTVHYYKEGTTEPLAPSKVVEDNERAAVTETYEKVAGYLPHTYQQTLIIDPDGTNEIIFYYTQDMVNGMYVVHYMTEETDGTFTEHSVFDGRGEIGSSVEAVIKDIDNFTYDEGHEGETVSGEISRESVLELWVYYLRNSYPYKVQYLEHGTNNPVAPELLGEARKWESYVTVTAPAIEHYTLDGTDTMSIQIKKDTEDPTVNIITFYYVEDKVTLKYEIAEGKGVLTPESEEVKILDGYAQGSVATPAEGYAFVGWFADKECTESITARGMLVPFKEEGEMWVDGTTYYAKFELDTASLVIKKDYPEGADYSMDENQTFIFDVKGIEGTHTENIDITVTVHGNSSITVTDLPAGSYTVTERVEWSWRYALTGENRRTVTLEDDVTTVIFESTREDIYWLDGNHYLVNIFKESEN